jgi:sugar lactone lactonase YvrE
MLILPVLATIVLNSLAAMAAPKAEVKPTRESSVQQSQFFPENELREGQTGYALTVFNGTRIDRFNVEILGVLHKVNNGRDWILIKVTSGPSVTDNLNIAEGMSGSPVYIDGKLVGAIAASIPFGRSPIGFVTPIADMLEAWDPDLPSRTDIDISSSTQVTAGDKIDAADLSPYLGHDFAELVPQSATLSIRPLETPVMVSGMTPGGIERLSSVLGPYGMTPMAGGGMAGSLTLAQHGSDALAPGAAVGFSLVQGDMDVTAIGTVTYRDGNRLIAFGHPFTDFGAIDAPMTTASIAGLIPSFQTSTKLGEPLQNVGRVFQDRPFSIGGEIGSSPHMVPMTVNVIDNTNKRHRRYHFEIIDHPLLTGPLVLQVAQQAILETHGTPGDAVATVTTTVDADQVGRITRSNVFYDSLSIEQSATSDLDSLVRLLTSNNFYPLSIKGVDMDVSIASSHATAQVDHIFVPKTNYEPGDTVDVGIVIKPYKQDPILKTISLKIPSSTEDGAVTVQIRGGGVSNGQTISLGGATFILRSSAPQGPTPANVNQLVRQYLDQSKNNDLVATLQLPTTAVTVQGENLSLLPPTMSAVMRSARSTGVHTARDEVKQTTPTDYVLTGSQSLTLTVARANAVDSSSLTLPGDTPPDTAEGDVTPASDDSNDSGSSDAAAVAQQSVNDFSQHIDTEPAAVILPKPPSDGDMTSTTIPVSISPLPAGNSSAGTSAADDSNKKKSVGRLAQIWRQDTVQDFSLGKLNNATISSANDVRLSFSLKPLSQSTSSYIWCLAQNKAGDVFAGTGDDGIVYEVQADGTMAPFFRTGELEVTSLAYDSNSGELYAGTSPHGAIYAIGADGVGKRLGTVGDQYVTALALDNSRSLLYAATGGGSGDIYSLSTAQKSDPKSLFISPETHLLSLAIGPSGTIYAGGSPDGVIYAITPTGSAKVVYESAQANITSLAVDAKGILYAGTSPAGLIYRIAPNTESNSGADVKVLSARPKEGVSGLGLDSSGDVWVSAGDSVYCINPLDTTYTFAAPDEVTLLSLLVGQDDSVYAGTGNTASIYRLGDGPVPTTTYFGTYTSPVHDTRRPSRWGTIAWRSVTPPGTALTLETRSGDVSRPDETWSDWSTEYNQPSGQPIQSPAARYIQYRALFKSTDVRSDNVPKLTAVSIYFLTRNQPPIVTVTSPSEGDFLSGTSTLHWTAIDPDHDTLSYDVYYSSDGVNYLPLPQNPTTTSPASADQRSQLEAELDKHPEIPQGVRDEMLAQASGAAAPGNSLENHATTNSIDWNTTAVPDGEYRIKVVASDYQSNPTDARTGNGSSQPFVIVNTPPVLTLLASAAKVNVDKTITVRGTASSKIAFVDAVQYQVDKSKDLYSAAADSGIFDSTTNAFTINTLPQGPGPHTITVTAFDQAGNSSRATTLVVVP